MNTAMAYSVGVDIGGTFTDCVVADAKGSINIFKTPSTPGEFERGFMDAFGLAADHYGQTLAGVSRGREHYRPRHYCDH